MYLIVTSIYPNDKAKEVANMYIKVVTKYPPDDSLGTPVVPIAVRSTFQGIEVTTVSDVKKGKLEDAIAWAASRLAMFSDIEGYRHEIKPCMNLEEAMKTLGM